MINLAVKMAEMLPKVRYCPVCPPCKPGFVFIFGRAKAIHNCSLKELKEWVQTHRTLEDDPLPLTGRKHELTVIVRDSVDRGVKHAGGSLRSNSSPSSSPNSSPWNSRPERPVSARQLMSCSESSETQKEESSLTGGSHSWCGSDDEADENVKYGVSLPAPARHTMPMKQGACAVYVHCHTLRSAKCICVPYDHICIWCLLFLN